MRACHSLRRHDRLLLGAASIDVEAAAAPDVPRHARGQQAALSLTLLGLGAFLVTADSRVVNPLLPLIAADFRTDIGRAGFLVTAYTIPYGLFQLLYGPLGDRLGKGRVITGAMFLFAVGTAACALAPTLLLLNLLRFLTGMAAAAMIPLSLAYIGDAVAYGERQAAIGKFLTAIALGQMLSTSLGGVVGDFLSWRYIFLAYGVVSLVVALYFWRAAAAAREEPVLAAPARGTTLQRYAILLGDPVARLVLFAVFVEGAFFYGGFAYAGSYLRERFNLLYLLIGLLLGGFGIGSLVYSRAVRWLVRRLGEPGMILTGGCLVALCYAALPLLPAWWLFIPLSITLGLGFSMMHSTLQTKATELAPAARGTAVSLFAFSLFLGQGIGAALLGLLVNRQAYDVMFDLSGGVIAILAIAVALRLRGFARQPALA